MNASDVKMQGHSQYDPSNDDAVFVMTDLDVEMAKTKPTLHNYPCNELAPIQNPLKGKGKLKSIG